MTASQTGSDVIFSWDKSSDVETLQNGLTYNLYVSTTPGSCQVKSPMADISSGYQKVVQLGNMNHCDSYTLKGLPEGRYYWSIQAIDNCFTGSAFAPEASFTISIPPAAPQNLTAAPGNQQITLRWNQNTESDLHKYNIYRDTSSPASTLVDSVVGAPPDTFFTDTGLANFQTYYYRIIAVDTAGNESEYSNEVSAAPDLFTQITDDDPVNDALGTIGCAWGDYDNDDDLDLFVPAAPNQNNLLYDNNGDGTFTKVATGNIVSDGGTSSGCSWGDFNNDGSLDIFVTNSVGQNNFLYKSNGDGTFAKITEDIIVNDNGTSMSCSWVDYDNDGDLDLFVANAKYPDKEANCLYRNDGNGLFDKMSEEEVGTIVSDIGYSFCSSWGDYDNDGFQDLFIASAYDDNNCLYHNEGNGTFTKIIEGHIVNDGIHSVSSNWVDYDNDGDLDLYVANVGNNFLYENDGNGNFTRITEGSIVTDGSLSYGSSWADFDNDGDLDLFIGVPGNNNNIFYTNNGDGSFTRIMSSIIVNDGRKSNASIWGDYDNDGDLDLFVTNEDYQKNLLYKNNGNINNWINIKCTGTFSNYSAIGAKVRLKATVNGAAFWQMREISGQNGLRSQSSLNAEFGLGDATIIDSIKVTWPNGGAQYLTNIDVNQFLAITEPDLYPPSAPQNFTAIPGNQQITIRWNQNTESDLHKYNIYRDTSSPAITLIDSVVGAPPDTFYTDTGLTNGQIYYYRITAVDSAGNESEFSDDVSATPYGGPVWYISTTGNNTGNGSETSPFSTIQHGIDASSNGDTVLTCPGTYVENINFNGKNIVVGSLFLTSYDTSYISSTIIDGNQDTSVVIFSNGETADAILCGVTLQNGSAYQGGGVFSDCSSPTLKNLRIIGNYAVHGGGILCYRSYSKIINVILTGNSANWDGGGLFCLDNSNVIISNTVINGNSSTDAGAGILSLHSTITLTNVTITDNVTRHGGGIWSDYDGNTVLVNCIVWGNTPEQIYFRELDAPSVLTVSYSNIQGGQDSIVTNNNGTVNWGIGNIDTDPLFIDATIGNYRLTDYSPCIGTGLDTSIVPITDLDGNPRPNPAGSNPDMGAYENSRATPIDTIPPVIPQNLMITDSLQTITLKWNTSINPSCKSRDCNVL